MKNDTYAQARPYLANPDQLCYARLARLEEGPARGQRIVDVFNGSGLAFTVTPDRGMNLVECSYRGIPVAFRTPCGHRGVRGDWLKDWTGGMMTTVGLRNAGGPSGDQGLHGSISAEAAEHVSADCRDGKIQIAGRLREGALFDVNLVLDRAISTEFGQNRIDITDRVSNHGEAPAFTEILYHCNFGYPFVGPDMEFDLPDHKVIARSEDAEKFQDHWMEFPEPLTGFIEHCYRHILPAGDDGVAVMRVVNRKLGFAIRVEYHTDTLPFIVEWKKPSLHAYVLGLEPTNASLGGQEFDRKNGFGRTLQPGEDIQYRISLVFEDL